MPDIDDDDTLSDAELDIIDLAKSGSAVMIDMHSAIEVERANRLLQRGLIKVVGEERQTGGPGVWTLVKLAEPGGAAAAPAPLVALP